MEGVQKRPLTGMLSGGISAPRAVGNGVATVVHTLDSTTDVLGGPFTDLVDLWVSNPTGAALTATVVVAGGTSFAINIPTLSTVKILDEVPFAAVAGTTSTITVSGSGALMAFWGFFARPL